MLLLAKAMIKIEPTANITKQVQNDLQNRATCTQNLTLKYEDTCNDSLTLKLGGKGQGMLTIHCDLPDRHGGKHEHQWDKEKGVTISWK
jgi:hypothetical protein